MVLLIVTAAVNWLPSLNQSFWLDETGTYWVIKDGLGGTLDRSWRYQGQSPLYYVLAWSAKTLLGSDEMAVRIPSLVAAIVTILLVYKIAYRVIGRRAALPAAVVFTGLNSVAFSATDARPYALGMALAAGATYSLLLWADSGKVRHAAAYVALVVLVIYNHYLFAPVLVGHVAFVVAGRRDNRISVRAAAASALSIFFLVSPLVPQLRNLFDRRTSLSVGVPLVPHELLEGILPFDLLAGMLVGGLASTAVAKASLSARPTPKREIRWLLFTWLVFPATSLFAISVLSDSVVFTPRYFQSATPALAVLAGWAWSHLHPDRALRVALMFMVAILFLAGPRLPVNILQRHGERWSDASSYVNAMVFTPETPVLVRSGFIESAQPEWLTDSERSSWLLAPLAAYPVEGRPMAMPYDLSDDVLPYLESILEKELRPADRFILVTNFFNPFHGWLDGRLSSEFASRVESFGYVSVVVFDRSETALSRSAATTGAKP